MAARMSLCCFCLVCCLSHTSKPLNLQTRFFSSFVFRTIVLKLASLVVYVVTLFIQLDNVGVSCCSCCCYCFVFMVDVPYSQKFWWFFKLNLNFKPFVTV